MTDLENANSHVLQLAGGLVLGEDTKIKTDFYRERETSLVGKEGIHNQTIMINN